MMPVLLKIASESDLPILSLLVSQYHAIEAIGQSNSVRTRSLLALIQDSSLGIIWMIFHENDFIGYIAICFCYSIEFGGRDCFVDEFFIVETHRNRGFGIETLENVAQELLDRGIRAISLEVSIANEAAKRFYVGSGFEARDRFSLMTKILKTEQGAAANP